MLEVKVDTKEFEEYMGKLISISNRSVNEVVKEQAVGLAKELMFVTQPFGDDDRAKKKGFNAVKRALILSVTPAEQIYKPFNKNEDIKRYVKKKNQTALESINESIPTMKHYKFASMSPSLQQQWKRKHNYDVRTEQGLITLDMPAWKRHLKVLEDRVGMLKSGWGKVLAALGSRVPAWIRRHINGYNFGTLDMKVTAEDGKPSITISNITGKGDKDVVEQAMARQVGKMKRNYETRLAHFLRGKSTDVKPAEVNNV